MKNTASFLIILYLLQAIAEGQTLTVNVQQLNFGTVYENNADSIALTVYNNTGKTVNVTGMHFYQFYGDTPFSSSESNFTLPDGGSHDVYIKFRPRHNIFHNSELVIENDADRGAVSVDLLAQGHYSIAYYDSTENLSEQPLKIALNALMGQNYISLGYNIARDSMFMSLDNKKFNGQGAALNTIECVYTGRNAVGYVDRTDCQTNFAFNTEHTWPQNFFSSLEPMRSDLHHLFPTDENANNVRGSYPFGSVTNVTWQDGGSKFDGNTNIFEPRDAHKGATARAMFYFVLRYQNYGNFLNSQESVLRSWNSLYPPSAIEQTRNAKIFQYQNNMNPFVDYPQFADRITSFSTTSVAPSLFAFDLFSNPVSYGTVAAGGAYIYSFIIVNKGNQDLLLDNFTLSNPGILSFITGGSSVQLPPGEVYKCEINFVPVSTGLLNEVLSFTTNDPSNSFIQVPVTANVLTSDVQETVSIPFKLGPDPVYDELKIFSRKDLNISAYDLTGKMIFSRAIRGNDVISMSEYDAGIYILSVSDDSGTYYRKIVRCK